MAIQTAIQKASHDAIQGVSHMTGHKATLLRFIVAQTVVQPQSAQPFAAINAAFVSGVRMRGQKVTHVRGSLFWGGIWCPSCGSLCCGSLLGHFYCTHLWVTLFSRATHPPISAKHVEPNDSRASNMMPILPQTGHVEWGFLQIFPFDLRGAIARAPGRMGSRMGVE